MELKPMTFAEFVTLHSALGSRRREIMKWPVLFVLVLGIYLIFHYFSLPPGEKFIYTLFLIATAGIISFIVTRKVGKAQMELAKYFKEGKSMREVMLEIEYLEEVFPGFLK